MQQLWLLDGTRQERTGWRDQQISARHRAWGFNCPAVDLDFLMVEFNFGEPAALVEYKHWSARRPDTRHATYRALAKLADGYRDGPLPFVVAYYWPEQWAFRVCPVNDAAGRYFTELAMLTERQFVSLLYRIRRLSVAASLRGTLNTALPPPMIRARVAA